MIRRLTERFLQPTRRLQAWLGKIQPSLLPPLGVLAQVGQIVLLGYLGAAILIGLAFQGLSLVYPYTLDYGEAPLIDQAIRLGQGQNIYRANIDQPPYTISNYPPVYVAALALFMRWLGPNYWVGRLISILSAFAAAYCLGRLIHGLARDRFAAAASAMTFLAIPYVLKWSSYLRIDLLALALSLAGLACLVHPRVGRRGFLAGALLLTAAIFTRQSYALAAPLAAFVWMLFRDRRRAVALAGLVGGSSVLLFLLLNGLTGGGFFFHIVTANVNEFGLERLEWHWRDVRHVLPGLLILAGGTLLISPGKPGTWPLVAPYLVGAAASAATIGKIGSNVNYLLELCAALSLAAGAALAWSRAQPGRRLLYVLVLGLLVFQVGRLLEKTLNNVVPELNDRRAAQAELRQLARWVASTPGPMLADEHMGMITLAGRPLELQPFEMTQLAWAGLWDQGPLLERIRRKEFSLILIHDFDGYPVYKERWTAEMLAAIEQNYTLARVLGGTRAYTPTP